MAKCEWCDKRFNREEAKDYFETYTIWKYSQIRPCLCGECAELAVADEKEDTFIH